MVAPAALHPLTPGSPVYALAKVSAVGGIFALRLVLTRRERRRTEAADSQGVERPPRPESAQRRSPHPVSRKRRRRRR